MERKIPIYFDTIILDSPVQEIALDGKEENGNRLQVGVFYKYKNRNGSYITDEYANYLIESATHGDTPVVGFFDPETEAWASHTGPLLANGYGYIEDFIGWKPLKDSDGITRDYAVFSVVLFTGYYDEAKKIIGQHQSMELKPETIVGDWANFDGEEYFVYTKGDMRGLCVIGSHEPCFSASSFFSANEDKYESQYEKFSSLLFELKALVEEAEKNIKGGEVQMDNLENNVQGQEPATFQEPAAEPSTVAEPVVTEPEQQEPAAEENNNVEFEALQQQCTDLHNANSALQQQFDAANARIQELEASVEATNTELESLRAQNAQLQATVSNYEAQLNNIAVEKKNNLIENYEKLLEEEEINPIRARINDFSYDELEGKLAIAFANKQMTGKEETKKVPLPEPDNRSSFALLIEKYKK